MFLRTSLFILAICVESHLLSAFSCSQKISWGEIITIPKDQEENYQNNLLCTFEANFVADIEPNVLKLAWYAFDISGEMPNCDTDYLEIYVSCSYKSIGRFCGIKRPSDVISPDSCLKMVFHSDSAVTGRGFKARLIVTARLQNLASLPLHNYRHLVKLNSSSRSGLLSSPGYPQHYPVQCPSQTFHFETTQKTTAMRLYFMEFNTRGRDGVCESHTDDILTIEVSKFNNDVTVHRLCGVRKPFILSWTGFTRISIKFTTNNDSSVSRGFVAGYIIYQLTGTTLENSAAPTLASILLLFWCLLVLKIGQN